VHTAIDWLAERQPSLGSLYATAVMDHALANEAARRYGLSTR
jgi:hypothetical protein